MTHCSGRAPLFPPRVLRFNVATTVTNAEAESSPRSVSDSPSVLPAALKAAVLLLLVCAIVYGPMLRSLGFYWDDWPGMMVANYLTPNDLRAYVASDRPASAFLFSTVSSLLGTDPLRAHVAALMARWLIALTVWWIVAGVWPGRRFEALATALLVAVYPGYGQHAIAWVHTQGVYIPLLLILFSFGCSVWSVRISRFRYGFTAGAIAAAAATTLVVEYFVGLELIRPVLMAAALGSSARGWGARYRKALAAWWPFLLILCSWFIWRVFFFHSARQATNQGALLSEIGGHPLQQLIQRILYGSSDVVKAGLLAWTQAAGSYIFTSEQRGIWLEGLLILTGVAVLTAIWLRREAAVQPDTTVEEQAWGGLAIVIGLFAMCAGGLPVWAANRHIILGALPDRYSLPLMFGSCLFAAGVVRRCLRTAAQQGAALALLAGIGGIYQFRTEADFAADWQLQRQLFWQLKWRAPGLLPGTAVVLVDDSALNPKSNYAVAVPLNLMYSGHPQSSRMGYWAFRTPRNDPDHYRTPLLPNSQIEGRARTVWFQGSTTNELAIWYRPPGCLRILTPSDSGEMLDGDARRAASLSRLDRIRIESGSAADNKVMGREPEHGWCYYFESAELARQTGHWAIIVSLGDQARAKQLSPSVAAEWAPFIEAYLKSGRTKDADALAARTAALARP